MARKELASILMIVDIRMLNLVHHTTVGLVNDDCTLNWRTAQGLRYPYNYGSEDGKVLVTEATGISPLNTLVLLI
jgi:hypothetical protein